MHIPLSRGDVNEHHYHRDQNCHTYDTVERKFRARKIAGISASERVNPHRDKSADDNGPEPEHDEILDVDFSRLVQFRVNQPFGDVIGHRVTLPHAVKPFYGIFRNFTHSRYHLPTTILPYRY